MAASEQTPAISSKERTLHDDAERLAEAGWPMSAVRVKEAAGEIERLRAALEKGRDYLQGEFYAEALGILDDALSGDSSQVETSPKPINQCDGCRRGLPIEKGIHRGPGGFWKGDVQACTAHLYQSAEETTARHDSSCRCYVCIGTPPDKGGPPLCEKCNGIGSDMGKTCSACRGTGRVPPEKASAERCRSHYLIQGRVRRCVKDEGHNGDHYNLTTDTSWTTLNGKGEPT